MELRTLVMQEMIRHGVLFQGIFVPSYSHTSDDVNYFASALNESLLIYKSALDRGVGTYLIGEATKPVFRKVL